MGTVKAVAADHVDRVSNPGRLIGDTVDAVSTVSPLVATASDAVTAMTSDDPVSAVGEAQGERLANQAMAVAGEGVGAAVGKGGSVLGKMDNVATVSPNVQKALNTLDEIKAEGGNVTMNKLQTNANQELNMTVTKGTGKVDVRVETHVVPKKYGGNGTTSQRHLNVDLYPKKSNPLPNKGHKILENQ